MPPRASASVHQPSIISFGYSIGDAILLTQLAWTVVQNSRKACGEHDELTREVLSLHLVLQRLEREVAKPESPINRPGSTCREELEVVASGCRWVLNILDQILEKYNALSETQRSGRQLWQKIKFGNGKTTDLADLRSKMIFHTSALSLSLNMVSLGTMGRVEQQMNEAGGDLKEIRLAVNGITAHFTTRSNYEGSVLTAYPDDDKAVWKEFRRELVAEGFSSSVIRKHKHLIKAYVRELGARGLLDDPEPQAMDGPSIHSRFSLKGTSTLTALGDTGAADTQSSAMPAAEKKDLVVQISPKTNADLLPVPEMQLNTEPPPNPDFRSGIESKFKLTEKGIVDVQGVTSLGDSNEDSILTIDTERPRQSHRPENLGVEQPNMKHSNAFPDAGAQSYCADKFTRGSGKGMKASTPNSLDVSVRVVAAVQATNPVNKDYESLQETANPDTPSEVIRVVSDAWYNEYLSTSRYPNTSPVYSAIKILRGLLSKLAAVDFEATGWSYEFKACRTSLIKQINIRLNTLERRAQLLRKHHIISPRSVTKSDASDNAKSIKDAERLFEMPPDLARETCDGVPLIISTCKNTTVRRLEILGVLHHIWHDYYDRVAPPCLKWVAKFDQGGGLMLPMNAEFMRLITCMRENKQKVEKLDLDRDVELIARRQELAEDIKWMVSSLRIFVNGGRWKWKITGIPKKGIGQRLYLDISWVKSTITCREGTKCEVCPASKSQ